MFFFCVCVFVLVVPIVVSFYLDRGKRIILRANVSVHQTNSGKSPKFVFSPTFIFCSPICSNNCGVVFLRKYILVFEK